MGTSNRTTILKGLMSNDLSVDVRSAIHRPNSRYFGSQLRFTQRCNNGAYTVLASAINEATEVSTWQEILEIGTPTIQTGSNGSRRYRY